MPAVHPRAGSDVVIGTAWGPLRLSVRVTGGGVGGVPVLLLHGLGDTGAAWAGVVEALGHDRVCVLPDLPGSGASERPRPDRLLAPAAQAATVLGLLDALGHDRAVLVAVPVTTLPPPARHAGLSSRKRDSGPACRPRVGVASTQA